ncbi:MAG: hypothetical protein H6624_03450 [Bdellovibrionaceae bacterium]|nr:hypothetical protein [Bdellovibrionales bacterium]MCB9083370.1 hypothetical protein [Pseudobdellovibrionaceae bacterium]
MGFRRIGSLNIQQLGRGLCVALVCFAQLALGESDFSQVDYSLSGLGETDFRKESFSLSLFGDRYLTDGPSPDHVSTYSTLGLNYQIIADTDGKEVLFHAWGQQALDDSREVHITVPEAYVGWSTNREEFHFGLGRRRVNWSFADQEWKLGLWQPLFKWDYLRPQEQGLIGVFLRSEINDWEVVGFASPLFLPDQGPQFTLTDGNFESGNRWFLPPQNQIEVFKNSSAIYYQLDKPRVEDVIFQSSWAFRVRKGSPESGFWLQWSTTNKPMNQLQLGLEGYHSLALTPTVGNTMAVIHTEVVHHRINTLEAGQSWDRARVWLSASEERPAESEMPKEWDQSPLFLTRVYGAHLGHALPLPGLPNSRLSWNYIKTDEQRIQRAETEPGLVGDEMKNSMQRFPLQQGMGFRWDAQLWNTLRRRLGWTAQYIYSYPDQASWFSATVKWGFSPRLSWHVGVDVLGVDPGPDGKIDELSAYSRYHQNDRIVGGMTYVF